MLRALEERGIVTMAGVALGDLEGVAVPPLLRQIVVGRVARLGQEAERLLRVAAVIGQQAALDLWTLVGEVDGDAIEAVAEQGLGARLLIETREGVAFAHALIREALYETLPVLRYNQLTFLALEPMTDRMFSCGHWLKRSKHCWAAVSSAGFVSKNSQWVTSRRKCRHSISMGLSHGL